MLVRDNPYLPLTSLLLSLAMLSGVSAQQPTPSPDDNKKKSSKSNDHGFWASVPTSGDTPKPVEITTGRKKQADDADDADEPQKKKKKGEFVIAPIPIVNPTLGNGLAVGAGYLFQLEEGEHASPPSVVGGAVFKTSNGSGGFGAAGQFHLKEDRYRILVGAGSATINMNFFGIGSDAGDAGLTIPLSLDGKVFLAEGLFRLHGKWYLGPRYHIMKMHASLNLDEDETSEGKDGPVIPPIDVELRTAAIGPHLKYDGGDDAFYPRKGSIFDMKIGFYGKVVGGNRTYQSYDISYNKYFSMHKKTVLATRAASCFVRGQPPFYDLCSTGLRGYEAGHYIDRNSLAAQAEVRQELPYRFGVVGFFGFGEVWRSSSDFRLDNVLPTAGVGLRFRLTKQNHVNLRIDYAWGKNTSGLYIGVTEAF